MLLLFAFGFWFYWAFTSVISDYGLWYTVELVIIRFIIRTSYLLGMLGVSL